MSLESPPLIYDPRYHTFESWASLMCEQYAPNQLSIPTPGMDWKEWGEGLKAIDVFTNEAIPGPREFTNWEDWVAALLASMNPQIARSLGV